jgi:hypothetical protein
MSQVCEIKDFHNIKVLKYPVHRIEYTYRTGSIAEKLVSDILRDEGIEVEPHNVNENGVDIRAKDVDIGIEVWNWCKPHEYNSRIQSIIENLKPYPFRALVTSFISKDVRDYIESTYVLSPIFVVELGFQILPKEWKHFYKNEKNILFYPSREAYVKVRQKMKPLIDAIKRVRRDKILAKYFPSYDYGNMVILDATGCTNEEFNNFLRDLEEHKETVALISVPEASVESLNKKVLSTKEGFNAYVYENNLNLKNESLKIRAKKRETGNKEARTGEHNQRKTTGSTFKDKYRTKLRSAFVNLLSRSSINSKNICENNSSKNRETGNGRARIEENTQSSTFRDKFRTELAKIGRLLIEANSTKITTKNTSAQNNGTKNSGSKNVNSKDGIENDGARTEEKTKSPTLNDYNLMSLSQVLSVGIDSIPTKSKNETENNEARTEEKTESSTSREYIVPPSGGGTEMRRLEIKEISFNLKEISPNEGEISTVSVKIRSFYNRFKASMLNLLFKVWNDKTGNVALTKKPRTFTWKPKYGFQVAPNQFQMRLIKQTYPCQYKFLVWCTEHKKYKYLCKLSNSFDYVFDSSIRLYKNRWFCFCNGDPEEYCSAHDAMCYYNMDREEKCRWHKPRMIEQELMAKAIEWKKKAKSGKKMVKVSGFVNGDDEYG